MANFSFRHKLLTMHGKLFSGGVETWNASLRINGGTTPTVSQAQVDAAFSACATWFTATSNAGFRANFSLDYCKLAPVLTTGKYPADEDSFVSTAAPVFGNTSTTNPIYPAQCTLAISLTTSATRGVAWTGRFYPPPPACPIGTDGLISPGDATLVAANAATLVRNLNGVPSLGLVYVMSGGTKAGFTAARPVIGTRVGRVIDTQRRRRRSFLEAYSTGTV